MKIVHPKEPARQTVVAAALRCEEAEINTGDGKYGRKGELHATERALLVGSFAEVEG
jgi:hypothetical protein